MDASHKKRVQNEEYTLGQESRKGVYRLNLAVLLRPDLKLSSDGTDKASVEEEILSPLLPRRPYLDTWS